MKPNIFLTLDSPIGAGKTRAVIVYCGYGIMAGEKFLVAQPTVDLCNQTYRDFKKRWPDLCAALIHSDEAHNVAAELKARTQACDGGMVIFCTHAGLIQSPFIANRQEWHLIVDEMPQTVWAGKLVPGKNRSLIAKAVGIADRGEKYSALLPRDDSLLFDIARDHSESGVFSHGVQDMARKLMSGWWDVRVLTSQWQQVMQGNRSNGGLLLFGSLDPKLFAGFSSTTFASANTQHTIAYLHFRASGMHFMPHRHIGRRLRYDKHRNGHLLTVYYAVEDNWSKTLRGKPVRWDGEKHTVNDFVAAGAMELFGDEPFAKLLNKDMQECDPFGENGVPLPHHAFGRNDFQHLHNAVVIPALNPTPAFLAYLRDVIGLKPEQVYRAIYLEQVYQASGRISIRNLDDLHPKRMVVADKAAAGFLAAMYPGAKLAALPFSQHIGYSQFGRPGRPVTRTADEKKQQGAERARRHRWRSKHAAASRENTYIPIRGFCVTQTSPHEAQPGFAISHWDSRAVKFRPYQAYEVQYDRHLKRQQFYTADEFEAFLRTQIETHHVDQKHDNDLVMASFVDLDQDPDHGHSKSNHVASQGVILDFDGTDLMPDEVHSALPYRMMVYSSWSHSEHELRYRVCIPTMPMAYDAMEAIRRTCVRKLEQAYPGRAVNVDTSKMTPVALFYLPSIRPDAMFRTYDGPHLEHVEWIRLCPADIVDAVMRLSPTTEPKDKPQPPAPPAAAADLNPGRGEENSRIVKRAISKWHERGLKQGAGRRQFWSFCRTLKERTTLPGHEIRQIAWEEAGHAHNPTERRSEIDNNLRD